MTLLIPAYLFSFNVIADTILMICVLSLIWFGAARMSGGWQQRVTLAGIISAVLIAWLGLAVYLGSLNIYWAPNNPTIPTIQFGLLLPIIAGFFLLVRSVCAVRLIDAIPLSWLAGVQFYRVLGFMFLVLWWDGRLPWQFALPAGIGDFATGIMAVVVAAMLARKASDDSKAAYFLVPVFGIADLIVAVTMETLTSPGRIHFVASGAPKLLITAYPLVMIPTFAVPVSIILHGLCLWKLHRMNKLPVPDSKLDRTGVSFADE